MFGKGIKCNEVSSELQSIHTRRKSPLKKNQSQAGLSISLQSGDSEKLTGESCNLNQETCKSQMKNQQCLGADCAILFFTFHRVGIQNTFSNPPHLEFLLLLGTLSVYTSDNTTQRNGNPCVLFEIAGPLAQSPSIER